MNALIFLIPCALGLAVIGLGAFMWSLRSGQFEDPAGAAARILIDEDEQEARAIKSVQATGHENEPGS
jgi:cbb3-type cytochrome oxidase maturation protein